MSLSYFLQYETRDADEDMTFKFGFGLKFLILLITIFVWTNSLILDFKVRQILSKSELTQEQLIQTIKFWPNAKTTELMAVRISGADPNCSILTLFSSRIIEIDSRYAQGWYIDALCRNTKRDFPGAITSMNRALELDPVNPVYLIAKAKLGIAAGEKSLASETLNVLRANYPDNPEITSLEASISVLP